MQVNSAPTDNKKENEDGNQRLEKAFELLQLVQTKLSMTSVNIFGT
jgi:hypothetical protein